MPAARRRRPAQQAQQAQQPRVLSHPLYDNHEMLLSCDKDFLVSYIEDLSRELNEVRNMVEEVPAQNPRGRPKPNLDKIQDILFTNQESIPEGVYLGLMDALVGK
jgi:hypothetical protein